MVQLVTIPLLVHATHEAGVKMGGIGAVLQGLLTSEAYNRAVERTILIGPMHAADPVVMERLGDPRHGPTIEYSSLHGIFDGVEPALRDALQLIEQTFEIAILYGRRAFGTQRHEVLLVDASAPNRTQADAFRYFVWERYGIDSASYAWSDEFNTYFDIAQPLFSALTLLVAASDTDLSPKCIIAHEWLGAPVVFAAQMGEPDGWRTIFYAHETATARRLVEEHSGHDTRFYNTLAVAKKVGLDLEQIFGPQDDLFKHPILKAAAACDNIFAVSALVADELRFLGGDFVEANIDLVYNGIPAAKIDLKQRRQSKARLQQYCENLLGYRPDFVFTHVTRAVLSKALWRDIRVLDHLDSMLAAEKKRAVLFVLSSSIPAGRPAQAVTAWEAMYGWPVGHRGDNGDLIGEEVPYFFQTVEPFNSRAEATKAVLVNQFGWSADRCGQRMPAEMTFMDIRHGSDLEFGQSIYEPFGIAQLEPLAFGGLCCVSNVCGCVGFAADAAAGLENLPNLIVADYVTLPSEHPIGSPEDALAIDYSTREQIEQSKSLTIARTIHERLPDTAAQGKKLLKTGYETAGKMSWEVVVRDYFLPGIERVMGSR